jgi:hypothetical protein
VILRTISNYETKCHLYGSGRGTAEWRGLTWCEVHKSDLGLCGTAMEIHYFWFASEFRGAYSIGYMTNLILFKLLSGTDSTYTRQSECANHLSRKSLPSRHRDRCECRHDLCAASIYSYPAKASVRPRSHSRACPTFPARKDHQELSYPSPAGGSSSRIRARNGTELHFRVLLRILAVCISCGRVTNSEGSVRSATSVAAAEIKPTGAPGTTGN